MDICFQGIPFLNPPKIVNSQASSDEGFFYISSRRKDGRHPTHQDQGKTLISRNNFEIISNDLVENILNEPNGI
jgi:hypothetical protein